METNNNPIAASDYAQALTLFNEKNFRASANMCRRVIKKTPENVNVINLLAINAHNLKKYKTAAKLYLIANKISPNNPIILNNQGSILRLQGDINGAIAAYQQAITAAPQQMEARFNLARLYEDTAQPMKAIECYEKILLLDSNNIQALLRSGNLLQRLQQERVAIKAYKKILVLQPNNVAALLALAICLQSMELHHEAIGYYQKILALQPDNAQAYVNLGVAYKKIEAYDEAIECYHKALKLSPNIDYIYTNLANALSSANRREEALDYYNKALSLNSNSAEAYNGLGYAQHCLADYHDADINFNKALALNAQHVDAHFNKALNYLIQGNLQAGWEEYEWRMRKPEMAPMINKIPYPLWDGSPLDGRTLIVFAEQGFGDNIQFIRYLPLIEKHGGKVIFSTRPELYRLFEQIPGIDTLTNRGELVADVDCYLPLLSMPRLFNTTLETIPNDVPYLHAYENDIASFKNIFKSKKAKINVGMCWTGSPTHKNTQNRSCQVTDFLPLLELNDFRFYSLQKTLDAAALPSDLPLIDLSSQLTDFAMTAAAIANLDLVITVDTSVAHLAGAMGKPVWNLLSFSNDWRWMRDRSDSPWYPTMRLYRQPTLNDWDSIFTQVKHDLIRFKKKH
jgi:tetratricopeptide (TPR) repeat protein